MRNRTIAAEDLGELVPAEIAAAAVQDEFFLAVERVFEPAGSWRELKPDAIGPLEGLRGHVWPVARRSYGDLTYLEALLRRATAKDVRLQYPSDCRRLGRALDQWGIRFCLTASGNVPNWILLKAAETLIGWYNCLIPESTSAGDCSTLSEIVERLVPLRRPRGSASPPLRWENSYAIDAFRGNAGYSHNGLIAATLPEPKPEVQTYRSWRATVEADLRGVWGRACTRLHDNGYIAPKKKRNPLHYEWFALYQCGFGYWDTIQIAKRYRSISGGRAIRPDSVDKAVTEVAALLGLTKRSRSAA